MEVPLLVTHDHGHAHMDEARAPLLPAAPADAVPAADESSAPPPPYDTAVYPGHAAAASAAADKKSPVAVGAPADLEANAATATTSSPAARPRCPHRRRGFTALAAILVLLVGGVVFAAHRHHRRHGRHHGPCGGSWRHHAQWDGPQWDDKDHHGRAHMPVMGHDHMMVAALHDTVGDVEIPQTPFDHTAAHHVDVDGNADSRHHWGYHGNHHGEHQRHAPWWFTWGYRDHEGRHHRHPVSSADLVPATGVVVEHVKVVVDGTPADSDTLAAMAAAVIQAAQAEVAQEVQRQEELQREQQQREQRHHQREQEREQRKQQREQEREQRRARHH
ncbi:hypothetical protein AMAG_20702 [Allomyces macrogynus ATCC 38327]|uniref:Uncharacterized protein n=1 Tax=Allomyces macrogynus (strain ATCC 38327) TaxID=578462 RepID=A0A0L0TE82_ALLM3|nr:hypothetical protein AMAG_20702 [Allomyces macrogynus ATCC 38327]|eukprot:KNE73188.1 hypothetical protein AMAG_20702 [Allomyces macrogynus ATCC 38327]